MWKKSCGNHVMQLKSYQVTDQIYDPINHLTQTELMEKFNLAFYEGQNLSKTDILSTFNETTPVSEVTQIDKTNDDYLIDYLISNTEDTPASTPSSEVDVNFDFNEFEVDFQHNVNRIDTQAAESAKNFDTETYTTESSYESYNKQSYSQSFSQFFVPPPFNSEKFEEKAAEDNVHFNNIDMVEEFSNVSLDLDSLPSDLQELEESACEFVDGFRDNFLPPVGTITKNNVDFNNFLRSAPVDDISCYDQQEPTVKNEFGHLIGTKCTNNNYVGDMNSTQEDTVCQQIFEANEDNQMVLPQSDALLNDDPLLSSTNLLYSRNRTDLVAKVYDSEYSQECDEVSSSTNLQCKWDNCYQVYDSQTNLVKHIEKTHVELKRGEEFTCFWENCPRKTKPFNARYKLLIHMRVHSGEKPNKCPFKGCTKAFSRLENLKIHQRSHTGERPYLCQFSNCSKSFSNSSDRAKHQRTHFDTKPYACQVTGCMKKYTDPSSLRKHVKNHTYEEQLQIKKKASEDGSNFIAQSLAKKYLDPNKQKAVKIVPQIYNTNFEHSYSNTFFADRKFDSITVKQDLKNKLCEKNKLRRLFC